MQQLLISGFIGAIFGREEVERGAKSLWILYRGMVTALHVSVTSKYPGRCQT
jgi:hypothetical protein